jgi:hypothetical protein
MSDSSKQLLEKVLQQYRTSADFNGLYFGSEDAADIGVASDLVRSGLVQVVSEQDYVNPHIRPWPSKRTVDEQVHSLLQLPDSQYGLCLYPTPEALAAHPAADTYPEEPYREAMLAGRGALELAFFRFDVLEQYRNDPRFSFRFYDFGCETVISDAAYEDEEEEEHDKIIMGHIGFAYDLSGYDRNDPASPIVRRVCAFYGDLAKLTAIHQQRWKTYQVDDSHLHPHPVWWMQQMGHWADGLGPFDRFFFEINAINELTEAVLDAPLFKSSDRPREFGWILRPSQQEWDSFVQLMDKLLSENLNARALDAAQAPRRNENDQPLGTINRLAAVLLRHGIAEEIVHEVLAPLRDIRSARNQPSHALRTNVDDKSFVHQQVEIMERVNLSLEQLRHWWQTHPANKDWTEPDYAGDGAKRYRM